MAHLFISHSSRDGAAIAQPLVSALESAGHRCWIAPRDVKPGVPYPGQIVAAMRDCAGLVLIVTPAANESPNVLQEVQLAGQHRKTLAPVIVNRTTPSDDLHYYLGVRHQIPWSEVQNTTVELLRTFPIEVATAPPLDIEARYDVVMLNHNNQILDVIKVVREYTSLNLADAKALVQSFPPVRLGQGLTYLAAFSYTRQLRGVGAIMLDPVQLGDGLTSANQIEKKSNEPEGQTALVTSARDAIAAGRFDDAQAALSECLEMKPSAFVLAELTELQGDLAASTNRMPQAIWLWRLALKRYEEAGGPEEIIHELSGKIWAEEGQ